MSLKTHRSTANLHVTEFKQRTRIDPKYAAVPSSAEQEEHERHQMFNRQAAWRLQHAAEHSHTATFPDRHPPTTA
jgi:hypothetical protein